jgi:hypothetical protein
LAVFFGLSLFLIESIVPVFFLLSLSEFLFLFCDFWALAFCSGWSLKGETKRGVLEDKGFFARSVVEGWLAGDWMLERRRETMLTVDDWWLEREIRLLASLKPDLADFLDVFGRFLSVRRGNVAVRWRIVLESRRPLEMSKKNNADDDWK